MAEPWHRWPQPLQTGGELRAEIYARDGNRCAIRLEGCTVVPTELDHIVPPPHGGAWFDPLNLRPACRWCNRSRGKNPGTLSNPARAW